MASRVDELHGRLAEQEATINQQVESSQEVYEASGQAMRMLVADLRARAADQEKDRRRVDALEQRLLAQAKQLDAQAASEEIVRARGDTDVDGGSDLDSIRRRLAAVEALVERRAVDTRLAQVSRPSPETAAATPLETGSPQLNKCPSALSPGVDQRHQHGALEQSPRLQLRSGSGGGRSEAVHSVLGADLLVSDSGSDALDSDSYHQLLAVATEKAEAAATAAATLSVNEGATELGKSATRQAVVAASDAVKRETDELAALIVSLLTGCRTELKRLADAFVVMRTRRQTSEQAIRSLAQKMQAIQKQDATEALANARRIGSLSAAIETLASEVDNGFELVAQQLPQAAHVSDSRTNGRALLHDVGSPSAMQPRDAFKKVKRLLPPTNDLRAA
jgi:phage FluMu protein gp41